MRPFDKITWTEAGAMDGLTGITGTAGQTGYTISGDTIILKDKENPHLCGLGSVSDTKPQGCAIVPTNGNNGKAYYGPGGINFGKDGWDHTLAIAPVKLFKGDTLTGQCSNTNVNEGSLVGADIIYGGAPESWNMSKFKSAILFREKCTITSAAAVTFNSGVVTLDSALTDTTNWFSPDGEYYILGTSGCISAATFGGIMTVTNLPAPYEGRIPGLIVNPLSAVTFNAGAFIPALQPIGPFSGEALPSVGMTATSAGAIACTMHMARTK